MQNQEIGNYAFIDGQNLHMGTTLSKPTWSIDLTRFRVYLKEKYNVQKAFYFLGYVQEKYQPLYESIQSAGFILTFKEHNPAMMSLKKGNVDTDIVFEVMRRLYKHEPFNKIILVSGDGDYYRLVQFLMQEDKLGKVLFPDGKRASSLYKKDLKTLYCVDISEDDIKNKISTQKKKAT